MVFRRLWRASLFGWRSGLNLPKTEMVENFFYDILTLDDGNNAHPPVALGAGEGVYLPGSGPGQAPIFWMSLAQFLRYSLDDSLACKMQGAN